MKTANPITALLLPAFLLVIVTISNAQTTYIANNNPGAPGGVNVFTGTNAIIDAMAAASNGDIIYVVPSPITYPTFTITKQLTFFGGGFDPDKDNPVLTTIGTTRIDISASNVRLSGFTMNGILYFNGPINNIMIDKCTIYQVINNGGASLGNILIHNNIIGQNLGVNQFAFSMGFSSSGIIISNNVIYHNQSSTSGLIQSSDGTVVENNVFIGPANSSTGAFAIFNSGTVKNNIFYGIQPRSPVPGTFLNNTFENNLSFASTDNSFSTVGGNTSVNNLEGVDPQFVNLPHGSSYSFSYDPHPQPGSMAIGNGEGGTDIGLFGGGSPFDLTGTPLPLIQVVDVPPTISQGSDLPVNIKGRGN